MPPALLFMVGGMSLMFHAEPDYDQWGKRLIGLYFVATLFC